MRNAAALPGVAPASKAHNAGLVLVRWRCAAEAVVAKGSIAPRVSAAETAPVTTTLSTRWALIGGWLMTFMLALLGFWDRQVPINKKA
jgi:hypothetical protein